MRPSASSATTMADRNMYPSSDDSRVIRARPVRAGNATGRLAAAVELRLGVDDLALAEARVPDPVGEVDDQADDHPADEPQPRLEGEVLHEVDAQQRADDREPGHERDAVAALEVGLRAPQDDHADVHDDEREQRADVDELDDLLERHEGGHGGDQDAERGGDPDRGPRLVVDLREAARHQ